mmetsp:Transcript_2598/g.3990  ORF Transcript_2598/g.3990 Transcript_2598/m.3990 type:complete len:244 (+) Transcript_2598:40-771(+)
MRWMKSKSGSTMGMPKPMPLSVLILSCLLLLITSPFANASFSIVVPSGEEECFFVRTPGDGLAYISGNFDCLDDNISPDPVSVILYDERMNVMWRSQRAVPEDTFSVATSGRFSYCISNGFDGDDDISGKADGIPRNIGFTIRVREPQRGLDFNTQNGTKTEGPDDFKTAQLLKATAKLIEGLETMEDHQSYLRSREASHRDLVERTFRRVVRWTVLEAIVLVCVSGGQVMYLKKFFEQRRYL